MGKALCYGPEDSAQDLRLVKMDSQQEKASSSIKELNSASNLSDLKGEPKL